MRCNSAGRPKQTATQLDDATKQIKLALQHAIGQSSRQFAETLCNEYLKSGDYSNINSAVTTVTQLKSQLCTVRLASPQGNDGADIAQKLRVVIHVLEDLLLNAMEGNSISDLQDRGLLLYQSSEDVC